MEPSSPPRQYMPDPHDEMLSALQESGLVGMAEDFGMMQDGRIPALSPEHSETRKRAHGEFLDSATSHPEKTRKRATALRPASLPAPTSEKASKGLRHFSMKVCKKVEEKGQTTYNEVADELVCEFVNASPPTQPGEKPQFDEKNIRRRVYDALNVLMAMDIISKEKKEIRWKGLPSNAQQDKEALEREKSRLQKSIEKKRDHLQQLMEQQVTYQNLIDRNRALEESQDKPVETALEGSEDTRIGLPFIVIKTSQDTEIQCEMTESRNTVMFHFNAPFEISDDNEILKQLGLHQADDEQAQAMFDQRLLKYLPEGVKRPPPGST